MRLIKNTENSEDLKALANDDNDIVNDSFLELPYNFILPNVKQLSAYPYDF